MSATRQTHAPGIQSRSQLPVSVCPPGPIKTTDDGKCDEAVSFVIARPRPAVLPCDLSMRGLTESFNPV